MMIAKAVEAALRAGAWSIHACSYGPGIPP